MVNFDAKSISDNLEFVDGIWFAKFKSQVSYPDRGNENCFQIEENSFWFRHRNNCIIEVVKQFPPEGTLYDVGGGNGFVSRGLEEKGIETVLIEPGQKGVLNARQRGLKNIICATLEESGFKPETLPAVGLFDVIEHIEDSKRFLKSIFNFVTKPGRIYLTVPACNFLWSKEDEEAGHFERYSLKGISKILKEAGFYIEYATYIFSILPLPIFLFRSITGKTWTNNNPLKTKKHKKEHQQRKGITDKLLEKTWHLELKRIKKKKKIPFGSSCLIAAAK